MGAQLVEVFYALYATCEVAYFAYIYAKVSKEHFLAVSSHTRAALLVGRFISGVLSQSLMHFKLMDIHTLNYLSLSAQIAATAIAIFLPKVDRSIYFYRAKSSNDAINDDSRNNLHNNLNDSQSIGHDKYLQAFRLMWKQLQCAYSNKLVILWSVWYACGMCGFLQYLSYIQLVWIAIDNRPEVIVSALLIIRSIGFVFSYFSNSILIFQMMWNGAVEAVTTLLSAMIALLASRLHTSFINTKLKVLLALFTMSLCASGAIFLAANASDRFLSYVGHVIFYAFYTFTITISRYCISFIDIQFGILCDWLNLICIFVFFPSFCSSEIAKELPEDSYGLIFGINTFFAYALQAILTVVVVSDLFNLNLNIFQQMNIYGGFLAVLGCSYILFMVIDYVSETMKNKKTKKIDLNGNAANDISNLSI